MRRSSDDGRRFIHVLDSAAMIGALTKGRSSSIDINRRCRQVASTVLAVGHDVFYVWISSKENPADAPSRQFEPPGLEQSRASPGAEAELDSIEPIVDLRELPLWNDDTYWYIHFCSGHWRLWKPIRILLRMLLVTCFPLKFATR